MQDRELYFFDLFAGAGGTSLGLEKAGFTSLGFIEHDLQCVKSHLLNFDEPVIKLSKDHRTDIRKVSPKLLKKKINQRGIGSLDLLVATPPCQGFSCVGRGKLNSLSTGSRQFQNDPRNRLYSHVLDFVRVLRPKMVMFENVPGMLNVRGKNVVERVCIDIEALGYEVKCSLLNASWYGVPQSRERVIILASRKDLNLTPEFPHIKFDTTAVGGHWSQAERLGYSWDRKDLFVTCEMLKERRTLRPAISVEDAIGDLPKFTQH